MSNTLSFQFSRSLALHAFIVMISILSVSQKSSADTVTQYVAQLNNEAVIHGGILGSTQPQTGIATVTLTVPDGNPAGATLDYFIQLNGLDLDGLQTPGQGNELDNVTAIHFHDTSVCVSMGCVAGDTAGTLHVFNTFGVPRGGDDNDMTFDPVLGTVTGQWSDADASPIGTTPAPTLTLSSQLSLLTSGEMFVMLHTNAFPSGAIGGYLRPVPEPSSMVLGAVGLLACGAIACRHKVCLS